MVRFRSGDRTVYFSRCIAADKAKTQTLLFVVQVDAEEVQFWISRSESRIQDRSLSPHSLKEHINAVQCEITAVSDQLERLSAHAVIIAERTDNQPERELVASTTANLGDQMTALQTLLAAKKNAANDAIDAWGRFLAAQAVLTAWTVEKTDFLSSLLTFQSLSAARSCLADYASAVKSVKAVAAKAVSDMGRELSVITTAGCAAGNLADLLSEAERERGEVATRLEARAALLTELCEEWDQCARKLAEAKAWSAKARDSLNDEASRRPLRDRLALREKVASDVTIQRRRAAMAWEKLQVHFNTEDIVEEDVAALDVAVLGREIDAELAALCERTREQARTLEACLAQLEKYQQVCIFHTWSLSCTIICVFWERQNCLNKIPPPL